MQKATPNHWSLHCTRMAKSSSLTRVFLPPTLCTCQSSLQSTLRRCKTARSGDDFKALVQSDSATQFGLFAGKREVNIGVFQKPSKELYFKQLED